jgi:hypothetical protein
MHRHVHGDDQGRQARILGTADHVVGDGLILGGVELIPAVVRRNAREVLDGARGGAGHDERHVGLAGGRGEHQVGAGSEESGATGRGDAARAVVGAPEQLGLLGALGDVHHVLGDDAVALEAPAVAVDSDLVVEAPLDEIKGDFREAALGQLPQVVVVDRLHARRFPGEIR